ncbi:MAG: hypothetical protein QW584_01645 [Thermofilaceae archaeon]
MISLRLMYSEKEERREALRLAKLLVKTLEKKGYAVKTDLKVYKNRKNSGGRIYLSLERS